MLESGWKLLIDGFWQSVLIRWRNARRSPHGNPGIGWIYRGHLVFWPRFIKGDQISFSLSCNCVYLFLSIELCIFLCWLVCQYIYYPRDWLGRLLSWYLSWLEEYSYCNGFIVHISFYVLPARNTFKFLALSSFFKTATYFSKARYIAFVLKVLLNPNQSISQPARRLERARRWFALCLRSLVSTSQPSSSSTRSILCCRSGATRNMSLPGESRPSSLCSWCVVYLTFCCPMCAQASAVFPNLLVYVNLCIYIPICNAP